MSQTILVVDDERNIVRLVQVNLERAGYTVVTAFDGREAMEKVESEEPDLVALDAMMPYMDGFEVLQALRKNQSTRDIPVIMLLTFAQDVEVFAGWQTSRDGYFLKPFNPIELLSMVKRLLEGDGSPEGNPNPPVAPPISPCSGKTQDRVTKYEDLKAYGCIAGMLLLLALCVIVLFLRAIGSFKF